MPLIKCVECGKMFSSFAKACPQCGCLMENQKKKIKCIECGTEFFADLSACPECGCPIEYQNVENNETSVPEQKVEQPEIVAVQPIAAVQQSVAADILQNEPQSTTVENEKDKSSEFKSVICPQCGSNEINFVSTDYGICSHCGTRVVLHDESNVTKAEIHIHADNASNNISYYGIKKNLNPAYFYRNVLIKLAADKNTPPDIFDAKFEPAKESKRHIGKFTGNVTGSYTAEIGYDMVREYQEWNSASQKYETKKEKYIKWEPFSGSYSGVQTTSIVMDALENDGNIEVAYRIANESGSFDSLRGGTDDIMTPTQKHIDAAMDICKDLAGYECERKLPGDHHNNFNFTGFAQVSSISCDTVPVYTAKYIYQGLPYEKSCFAVKGQSENMFGKTPNISEEIKNEVDTKTKKLGIVSLILLLLSIVLSAIFNACHESMIRGVSFGIIIPIFIAAVAVTVAYFVIRYKTKKGIINANLQAKVEGIGKIFNERGLTSLTSNERDLILGAKKK